MEAVLLIVNHFKVELLYGILLQNHQLNQGHLLMEHEKIKKKSVKEKSVKSAISKAAQIDDVYDAVVSEEDEQHARAKLRELKKFYTDLLVYGVVCACSIIVWLSMGAGTFWPIWVIIGCGINVALKGISLGQIPLLEEFFPFLGNSWEESQLEKVLNRSNDHGATENQHSDYDVNHKSD